jgi:hypothetical protein
MGNRKSKNIRDIFREIVSGLIIYLLFVADTSAHTVVLKDLSVVFGQVQRQDGEYIYLKSDKGMKQIPKKDVGKILFQDIKDEAKLKKIIKKVRKKQNPSVQTPRNPDPPSQNLADFEIESAKYILAEIEREEREEILPTPRYIE